MAQKSIDLIEHSRRILAAVQPTTVRSVCYQLFTRGLILRLRNEIIRRIDMGASLPYHLPYHLPDLLNALGNWKLIIIDEGERCVDLLRKGGSRRRATLVAGAIAQFGPSMRNIFARPSHLKL